MKKSLLTLLGIYVLAQIAGFLYGAQHELRCEDNTCKNMSHRLSHPDRF